MCCCEVSGGMYNVVKTAKTEGKEGHSPLGQELTVVSMVRGVHFLVDAHAVLQVLQKYQRRRRLGGVEPHQRQRRIEGATHVEIAHQQQARLQAVDVVDLCGARIGSRRQGEEMAQYAQGKETNAHLVHLRLLLIHQPWRLLPR